jgi:V8-like Glu-specific endopeptidase
MEITLNGSISKSRRNLTPTSLNAEAHRLILVRAKHIHVQRLSGATWSLKQPRGTMSNSIGNITSTLSELKIDFDEESKKEELDIIDEGLDEETSIDKTTYQDFDMRFSLHDLQQRDYDEDILNRMRKQAKSIACIVPFGRLKKINGEYVTDGGRTLNGSIIDERGYGLAPCQKFSGEPVLGYGTAFLVCDKRTVLTASHCLFESNTDTIDSKRGDDWFVFNFQLDETVEMDEKGNYKQKFKKNQVYTFKKVIAHYNYKDSGDFYGDWALLKLDREVEDGVPLELDISDITENQYVKKEEPVYMLGHPGGLPLKVAINAKITEEIAKKVKEVLLCKDLFESNIDGFRGNSGSPVFHQTTGKVVGLFIHGNQDYERRKCEKEYKVYRMTDVNVKDEGYEKCQKINSIFFIPLYMNYLSHKSLLSSNSWQLLSLQKLVVMIDNHALDTEKIEAYKDKTFYKKAVDSALQIIKKQSFDHITSLDLSNVYNRITDKWLKNVEKLTNLTSLDLSFSDQLTDTGLKSLEKLTSLTSLDLSHCYLLTDTGLKSLEKLTNLTSLGLVACRELTDTGVKSLKKLMSLTSLSLYGCKQLTDAGIKSLEKLTSLTSLDLGGCEQLTDAVIKSLEKLTSLTSLDLGGCEQLTDAGIKSLEELTKLTSLDLSFSDQLTDTELKSLEKLTSLTSLNLCMCKQLTDTGLKSLEELTRLTLLKLSWCDKLTDTGLKSLEKLTKLTSLDLERCDKLTDLKSLEKLTNLTALNLFACNELSLKAVYNLRKKVTVRMPIFMYKD